MISTLQKNLIDWGVDALLLENPIDILYLTGLQFSRAELLITQKESALIVDNRYYEQAQNQLSMKVCLQSDKVLESLLEKCHLVGFDGFFTSVNRFDELRQDLPSHSWVNIPQPLKKLRSVKTPQEREKLIQAAFLGSQGYDFLLGELKEGVTEKELVRKLDFFWKERNASGFAFEPIIAFGKNSSMPHYRPTDTALKPGDIVLIDIGVTLDRYHSDMTRCVFFKDPPKELLQIYEIVLKAQELSLEALKPGVTAGFLDSVARTYIESQGYGPQFKHSLGHGVGLEIHEYPFLRNQGPQKDSVLEEGMCITIEPGIYLDGIGGVRIEDTVFLTKDGYENLTQRPKQILYV